MYIQKIKEFVGKVFTGSLSNKEKTLVTISLGWILFIGYLTWFNGLKNPGLDKSFRWDEWIWFGVIPAIVPYLFYFVWVKKERKNPNNFIDKQNQ